MDNDGIPADASELRDWLRDLKERSQLSFADLARATGEDERNLKRWMTAEGRPVTPSGDALLKLLGALGVSISPAPPSAVTSVNDELRRLRNALVHGVSPALTELSELDQLLLTLRYVRGLDIPEITEVLRSDPGWESATPASVALLLDAAHRQLGQAISPDIVRIDPESHRVQAIEEKPHREARVEEDAVPASFDSRLAALEERVGQLPTADDLKRGLESIRRSIARANRGTPEAPAKKSSGGTAR